MKLKELQDAMIAAMKAKDKFRKDAIAALVSAVKKKGIDAGCREDIPDEMANEAILKEIKSVKEQIDTCPADRTELLEEYKEEAEQKKITLLMEWTARNTQVKLDLQEMHRVFINLFENSVKYRTKERSVIKLILDERGTDLEIRVADDGPGVPEADLEHIFNSFYRGDASRTKPGSGSGLGLAIVKQIVEGHGGKICAYNDHGLVIVITLPLVRERLGGSRENGKGETGENEENTGG